MLRANDILVEDMTKYFGNTIGSTNKVLIEKRNLK